MLLCMLLIFESMQQAATGNFMLVSKIFKISKMSYWTFSKRNLLPCELFFQKSRQTLPENFFNPQCKCGEVLQSCISKAMPPFLLTPPFRIYMTRVSINKMLKEHTVDTVQSLVPQGYIYSYFYGLPRSLSFQIIFKFSIKLVYSIMIGEKY